MDQTQALLSSPSGSLMETVTASVRSQAGRPGLAAWWVVAVSAGEGWGASKSQAEKILVSPSGKQRDGLREREEWRQSQSEEDVGVRSCRRERERQQRLSGWSGPSLALGFRKLPGCRGQLVLGTRA